MRRVGLSEAIVAACVVAWSASAAPQPVQLSQLADLPLEALANIEVTSVSRRAESLLDAPASVYVITAEEIRRSGVTSLPEALRLAPNLQVARIDAGQYAISARGFNNVVANKLLVLVDGRTIYTPLFSGVFWDQQDLMLEDIERIEVISGPGGTLWGANAVNGVINVITKAAAETRGALVSALAGNREYGAAARFGGELGDGHYRVYAKGTERQNSRFAPGGPPPQFPGGQALSKSDGREHVQAGFRADWGWAAQGFTLQGDAYEGSAEDPGRTFGLTLGQQEVAGGNLLARWTRTLDGGSDLRLQAYLDHARREDRVLFDATTDTADVELQHGVPLGAHRLLWGGGYRKYRDDVRDAGLSGMRPMKETLEWYNVFLQGKLALARTLELTLGAKAEHNDYSGTDYLPSARLAWKPADDALLWAAASRAVRAPARFDRDVALVFPGLVLDVGGPRFESEVADVYELGLRAQATPAISYSATLFLHEWDRLRSAQLPPGAPFPFELRNQIEGHVYGFEGWAAWRVTRAWRLSGGLMTLRKRLDRDATSNDPLGADNVTLGSDPSFQWNLRSSLDLGDRQDLDVMLRRVGALPVTGVEVRPYTGLDVRYAWRASRRLELSLTVQNLQERWHPEFRASASQPPSEIERSLLLAVRWES
jgi:iron complex outermembrane receptor protein